jgi:hypothetical protein
MICSGPFKLGRISFSQNTRAKYEDINYDIKDEEKGAWNKATESKEFSEQVVNSFILERNSYYYRDSSKDQNLDVSVTPYRIIVDCAMDDETLKEAYENGTVLYMGDIPMSLREE